MLLALALIFLPIIFDGQGSYQVPITSRIPDPPAVAVLPEPIQTRPVIVADTLPDPVIEEEDEPEQTDPDTAVSSVDASTEPETDTGSASESEPEVAISTSEPVFSRDPPQLGADGLPQGWAVRLGSFSDAANAANLVQRLQDAGYRAYTRAISSAQGSLTGVFVGPWLDRARVDDYQRQLQEQFQLAGMIVRYELEQL